MNGGESPQVPCVSSSALRLRKSGQGWGHQGRRRGSCPESSQGSHQDMWGPRSMGHMARGKGSPSLLTSTEPDVPRRPLGLE